MFNELKLGQYTHTYTSERERVCVCVCVPWMLINFRIMPHNEDVLMTGRRLIIFEGQISCSK